MLNKRGILISLLLFNLFLAGCVQNDNEQNVSTRTENGTDLSRVKYTPKHGGPAMTTHDISDPGLDVHKNRRNDNIPNTRNVSIENGVGKVSDQAANKVASIPEVNRATVIVKDNNAYVAVKLKRTVGYSISPDLEDKIFRTVKAADEEIDNVYISANPNFSRQMNHFVQDINNGRHMDGFSDTIRRVFPDAK